METKRGNVDVKDMMRRMNGGAEEAPTTSIEHKHGEYTGDGGIVVEKGHEERKQFVESGVAEAIQNKLIEMDNAIHLSRANGSLESAVEKIGTLSREQLAAQKEIEIRSESVRKAFANVDVTAKGLSISDDPNVQRFKDASNDLINGRAQLPSSVEESKNMLKQSNVAPNASGNTVQQEVIEVDSYEPRYEQPVEQMTDTKNDSVVINVDSRGGTNAIMASLPIEQREKVEVASKILINEVEKKDVPVATRKITSMEEFRAIRPRATNIKPMETYKVTLVNSGLVVEVNGAGAMELVTILPDNETSIDWHKRYVFCHKHVVNTSIGKLSFGSFVERVHPEDIPAIIHGILTVAYPDTDTMEILCGGANCGGRYGVEYRISELLDIENLNEKTLQRAEDILEAYSLSLQDSQRIHESMPHRKEKYVELSKDVTVKLTTMNGSAMINKFNLIESIAETYNAFVSFMMLYVDKVILTMQGVNDTKPEVYEISDVFVIANLIFELTDEESVALKGALASLTEEEVAPFTYTVRGDFSCPHCGKKETSISINVDSMVFTKVRKALM